MYDNYVGNGEITINKIIIIIIIMLQLLHICMYKYSEHRCICHIRLTIVFMTRDQNLDQQK